MQFQDTTKKNALIPIMHWIANFQTPALVTLQRTYPKASEGHAACTLQAGHSGELTTLERSLKQ
jgi:hypothetical protein